MAGIIPTRTLAKLYEEQQFYLEAYIIYKILYASKPAEYLKNKILDTGEKIFAIASFQTKTTEIFSKKEIIEIGILPKKKYDLYQKIASELADNPKKSEFPQESEEKKIFEELKEISGEELFEIIKDNFPDRKPEEIKLAEIYEIIKGK